MLTCASWCADTKPSTTDYTYTEDQIRAIVKMADAYFRQAELIATLQRQLSEIQASADQAERRRLELELKLTELRQTSERLRTDLAALQAAGEKRDQIQEAEIGRLKKSRWKWALTAGAIGLVTGIVFGAVAK